MGRPHRRTRIALIFFTLVAAFGVVLDYIGITFFPGFSSQAILARECAPTDQDRYVYRPWRFEVLSDCVHVSGVVKEIDVPPGGDDGDANIQLAVDSPFALYLNEASRKYQNGYLHVEVICFVPPSFIEVFSQLACGLNPDPNRGPMPAVGQQVWMEGRLVLDNGHEGWTELHPLYRWGALQ